MDSISYYGMHGSTSECNEPLTESWNEASSDLFHMGNRFSPVLVFHGNKLIRYGMSPVRTFSTWGTGLARQSETLFCQVGGSRFYWSLFRNHNNQYFQWGWRNQSLRDQFIFLFFFIMFAPPDWTPMPPVILHIKAAFISFRVWRRKMDPKNVIYIEHPTQCFLSSFFSYRNFGEICPSSKSNLHQKNKNFPIYFSEHGEIKPDKIKRHLPSIRKGAHEGPARKKRKFLNLQSSFSQATHIKFVF